MPIQAPDFVVSLFYAFDNGIIAPIRELRRGEAHRRPGHERRTPCGEVKAGFRGERNPAF